MKPLVILLSLATLLLGCLRLYGVSGEAFQAIAHLYTGGLFGAYLASRRKAFGIIGLSLSAVELFAFLRSLYL